jgi:hypothetical protein
MTSLETLVAGVVALAGIVGILMLVDKLKTILAGTFVTKVDCAKCHSVYAQEVNKELKIINTNQVKQSVILAMVANNMGIDLTSINLDNH